MQNIASPWFLLATAPWISAVHSAEFSSSSHKQEESLFVQRIVEFWEEGEEDLTKSQIQTFLQKHPESSYRDQMFAILAEYALKDQHYVEAEKHYKKIEDATLQEKLLLGRMECLYQIEDFSGLISLGQSSLTSIGHEPEKKETIEHFLALSHLAMSDHLFEKKDLVHSSLEHLEQAETLFASLKNTQKYRAAFLPLIALYEKMGLYEKAVNGLFEAANLLEEKKEDLLFQAASLQVHYAPEEATQTFSQVCHLQGSKKGEAAYNKLLLLFEQKRYEEMLLVKEDLFDSLQTKQKHLLHFFVGKAYEILEDFPRSIASLNEFLAQESNPSQEVESALLSLAYGGFNTNNLLLVTEQINALEKDFPHSLTLAEAYWIRAKLEDRRGQKEALKKDYVKALTLSRGQTIHEEIAYEYAEILYKHAFWADARNMAKLFVTKTGPQKKRVKAWKIFLNAAIFSTREKTQSKEDLLRDLELALQEEVLFSPEDRHLYLYYYAKTSLDNKAFSQAIDTISLLLDEGVTSSLQAPLYVLLGKAYGEGMDNDRLYAHYVEKALAYSLPENSRSQLELGLFNALLREKEKTHNNNLLKKGAKHLCSAYMRGASVNKNNLLWLFTHVSEELLEKEAMGESDLANATSLFQKIGQESLLADEKKMLTLQMASLFEKGNSPEKEILLLEGSLMEFADEKTSWKAPLWFSLGNAYLVNNDPQKALAAYKQSSPEGLSSAEELSLPLEKAKAALLLLHSGETLDREHFLTTLKTLLLAKNLSQEPVHLEAAFLYIDWSLIHLDGVEKEKKRIFLLEKMLDHFLTGDDVLSQAYQKERTQMPEKEAILLSYLDLFELELLIAKSALASLQKEDAEAWIKQAKMLAEELEHTRVSPFFSKRLQALQRTLGF
ncbi:MAG: hypothetical protein AAGI90_01820 [Chlamydiota bacterium]